MTTTVPSLDALVYQALTKQSDAKHLLSMTDLRSYCDLAGHPADRRTIYKSIDALKAAGVDIVFVRKKGKQGYYLKHLFTNAEALFLMNACRPRFLSTTLYPFSLYSFIHRARIPLLAIPRSRETPSAD